MKFCPLTAPAAPNSQNASIQFSKAGVAPPSLDSVHPSENVPEPFYSLSSASLQTTTVATASFGTSSPSYATQLGSPQRPSEAPTSPPSITFFSASPLLFSFSSHSTTHCLATPGLLSSPFYRSLLSLTMLNRVTPPTHYPLPTLHSLHSCKTLVLSCIAGKCNY